MINTMKKEPFVITYKHFKKSTHFGDIENCPFAIAAKERFPNAKYVSTYSILSPSGPKAILDKPFGKAEYTFLSLFGWLGYKFKTQITIL